MNRFAVTLTHNRDLFGQHVTNDDGSMTFHNLSTMAFRGRQHSSEYKFDFIITARRNGEEIDIVRSDGGDVYPVMLKELRDIFIEQEGKAA